MNSGAEERWPVPNHWTWVQLGEIAEVVGGSTPKNASDPSNFDEVGLPWITPADLSGYTETHIARGERNLSKKGQAACSVRVLPTGTVLFSSRAPVGYCAIAANPIATNQGFRSFVLSNAALPEFTRYYLLASKAYAESKASGTTFKELSGSAAKTLAMPIAPVNEQQRIASKIDELFSRIDAGEAALKRAMALVERYRKSILKAAVTGELTKEWREKNKDKIEPADQLLKRILKARREAWETAELTKMKAKGKPPKDDAWKKKYVEPTAPNTSELSDLPEGWLWVTIAHVASVTGGLTKSAKRGTRALTIPMLRVANVYADKLDLSEIHDTTLDCGELERVKLQTGDLLVVEGNGSIDKIGRVAIWDGSIQECVHQNHLIKLRFADQILGRYCLHWMLSISGRECIERVASSSSGLHTLSISKLASLPIPIAGSSELLENVRLAEDRLAEASRMQFALKSNDKSATGLRQSVLRTAFEGKLAPQDPNDEPASVLLDRIRNAAHSAKSKITKRGK